MLDIILLAIFTGMATAGIRKAADPEYLFHPVDVWSDKHLPGWLDTIIIGCVTCMSSLWGSVAFWLWHGINLEVIWLWPLFVGAVAFAGTWFYKQIE